MGTMGWEYHERRGGTRVGPANCRLRLVFASDIAHVFRDVLFLRKQINQSCLLLKMK